MNDAPMEEVWFLYQGGQLTGPLGQAAAAARCQGVDAEHGLLLWCQGAADWLPARLFTADFPEPDAFRATSLARQTAWHYAQEKETRGPVSEPFLRHLLQTDALPPQTLVWHQGLPQWQPATAFPHLFNRPPLPDQASPLRCAHCGRLAAADEGLFHAGNFCCAACKTPYFAALAEQGTAPVALGQPGGFLLRLAAKLADGLLLYVLCLPLNLLHLLLGLPGLQNTGDLRDLLAFASAGLVINLLSVVLQLAYSGYFLSTRAATPGKLLLKLQVVRSDGRRLTFWRGVFRSLAESFGAMLCGIGYLMILTNPEKCGLHDYLCDTRVIHKSP